MAYQRIAYSLHARQKLIKRRIDLSDAEAAINAPERRRVRPVRVLIQEWPDADSAYVITLYRIRRLRP